MPDAVIVATARTPIGRAMKGSLVDCRPDDLTAQIITAVLAKVPQLTASEVEDVMIGCGQPAGEAGYNVARVAALLAGVDVPGVTVNRYCSSSLQTIRMASHAIQVGEGDVFVAGGVETVSRFGQGASDVGSHNVAFADAERRTADRAPAVTLPWTPGDGLPDVYIAMGQTAENVAEAEKVSREDMDEFACRSQQLAVASQENGFFEREITPVETPDGTIVSKDDGPRPGTTIEGLAALKPVFREGGTVTAGNACPLNDGAAAVVVMSRTRADELGIRPLAHHLERRLGPKSRDHGARADRCEPPGARARRDDDRRHRPRGDQRGIRRTGDPVCEASRDPDRQTEREGWCYRPGPPLRHDRRTHHDHASERAGRRGQDDRPRDDVRRWRPGNGDDRRAPLLIHLPGRRSCFDRKAGGSEQK